MAIPRNSSTPAGMDQLQQQQQLSTTPTTQPPMVPQSAPAHMTSGGQQHFLQTGNHKNNNAHQTNHHENNAFQYGLLDAHHPRNTYHNNRHRTSLHTHHHRSNSGTSNINMPHAQFLQRRNTSLGIDEAAITNVLRDDNDDDDELMQHPEKLLSGLSLALMSPQKNANDHNSNGDATTEQVEKRRAALHHAPPHLMEAQQQQHQAQVPPRQQNDNSKRNQPTHAGEYGYAYNNHIAWQQIRPSATVPIALPQTNNTNNSYSPSRATRLSSSPSPLAGTPPTGGAFLRMAVGSAGSAAAGGGMLIPPRNSANNNTTTPPGGCAPPFPNRPIGFIHEPPSLLQDPAQQLHTFPQQQQQQQQLEPPLQQAQSNKQPHDATNTTSQMAPPMTSLDLLHSSPFQQGASVLSSFSAVAGGPTSTTGPTHAHHNPPQGSLSFMRASASAIVAAVAQPEDDGLLLDYDDMPFAVDLDSTDATSTTTKQQQHSALESSPFADHSIMSSSSAVATFAQKCAPAQHRLKLFETLEASSSLAADKSVFAASTELTNQLAEFRTFGASLSLAHHPGSSGGGSGSDDTGSSMTPIPLRTS